MTRVPRILASVILSAALALPAHAEFNDVRRTLANANATVWLEDATIYCVPTGTTVTIDCGTKSGSGIDFADNAYLAAINIPTNSKLKVVGANGSDSTPGCAGIHLPPGTSLIVFGDGTLEVQGGKAGDGGSGSKGGDGVIHSCDSDSCNATGGRGSAGGTGGGGAGAGIGGNGGVGASASSSVDGLSQDADEEAFGGSGKNGFTGSANNQNGESAGSLYVLGGITLKATGGAAGSGGSGGSQGSCAKDWVPGFIWDNDYYTAGSGGGGGGGGGGGVGASVGGGGGGGGGSGGSGGLYYMWSATDDHYVNITGGGGGGGGGGNGASSGSAGKPDSAAKNVNAYAMSGLNGGDGRAGSGGKVQGGEGWHYKSHGSSVAGQTNWPESESHLELMFRISFENGEVPEQFAYYGARPPAISVPHRYEQCFLGCFTEPGGRGRQFYAADGQPTMSSYRDYWHIHLYPYFVPRSEMPWTGVTINGWDAAYRSGNGWSWSMDTHVLSLNAANTRYELAGTNLDGRVSVSCEASNLLIELQELRLENPVECPFTVLRDAGDIVLSSVGTNIIASTQKPAMRIYGETCVTNMVGTPSGVLFATGGLVLNDNLTIGGGRFIVSNDGGDGPVLHRSSGRTFLVVSGGTLVVNGGSSDIGLPESAVSIKINGGSVRTSSDRVFGRPFNDAGQKLRCVVVGVPDCPGPDVPVQIANLGVKYGVNDLYPIDERLYLWLPDNAVHTFDVNGMSAVATPRGTDTNALFCTTGVWVDGQEVGTAVGDGWRWSPASSNLVFVAPFAPRLVTGTNLLGEVHACVRSPETQLVFKDLHLTGWGVRDGIMEIASGAALDLELRGRTRIDGADSHYRGAGVFVPEGASLTVSGGGALDVTGGHWGAGIGGSRRDGTGQINFLGAAAVTAQGGFEGAGVGGGVGAPGGTTSCTSPNVVAHGGFGAADFGGGAWTADEGGVYDAAPATAATDAAGAGCVVSSLTDAALRAAVACAAAQGGTVTFASGLSGTISLTRRLAFSASNSMTIDGDGRVTLAPGASYSAGASDGGGALLNVGTGALTVRGVAFAGFANGTGGAVCSRGALTLRDCTFTDCSSTGWGGAAYASPNVALTCENCRFENCSAAASGGALFARGNLSVSHCTFKGCSAVHGGSAAGSFAPGGVAGFEHSTALNGDAGERAAFDVGAGKGLVAACTLAYNAGGGLYAEEELYTVSALSVGGTTRIPTRPADADVGLYGSMLSAYSTFGRVTRASGTASHANVTPVQVFHPDGERSAVVDGVEHAFIPLTHANKAIVQGCAAWRTPTWSTLSASLRIAASSPKTVVSGGLDQIGLALCGTDQVGVSRTDGNLLVGAVVAAAERESLVVTTLNEVESLDDGLTSLREAIAYAASDDMPRRSEDGYRVVTFADGLFGPSGVVTQEVTGSTLNVGGGRFVAIQGPVNGASLVFVMEPPVPDSQELFKVDADSALELANLTIAGDKHCWAVTSAGDFTAKNCLFRDGANTIASGMGTVWLECCTFADNSPWEGLPLLRLGSASGAHALNCTFTGNQTMDMPLLLARTGSVDVVDCTFAENAVGTNAVVKGNPGANLTVLNSIVAGNGVPDARNVQGGSNTLAIVSSVTNGALSAVFDGARRATTVRGVQHLYYRQLRGGPAYETGVFAFHDTYWNSLAYGSIATGGGKAPLRGVASQAVWGVKTDIVGRPIVQGHVSPGSYATCCDPEYFDDGVIIVNLAEDVFVPNDYDGQVTLREAVDYAQDHPEFRDDAGDCTILFADAFFDGRAYGTVRSVQRQIEVTRNFTTGRLRIAPPADRTVRLNGDMRYRLFYVGPSNRVDFANMSFEQGLASVAGDAVQTQAGGALLNDGFMTVSNCVFRDCRAGGKWEPQPIGGFAYGGAVCTRNDGLSVLNACTFEANAAGWGGALATLGRGRTLAFASTFTGNRTVGSYTIVRPSGGAVYAAGSPARTLLANCTIVGNESAKIAGGVCQEGDVNDVEKSLLLLNTVVAGNSAPQTNDLWTTGGARLVQSFVGGDVFDDLDADGVPRVRTLTRNGLEHVYFLLTDLGSGTALKADATWENVGYGSTAFWGTARYMMKGASPFACDQLGTSFGSTPPIGSIVRGRLELDGVLYASVDDALAAAPVGAVLTQVGAGTATEVARTLAADDGVKAAVAAALAAPASWFTVRKASDRAFTAELNELARPEIGVGTAFDAADGTEVSLVWPLNVKPCLWYGLGVAATPVGPYVVPRNGWVQADAEGVLPTALRAPKNGTSAFYRIIAADAPQSE